MRKLLYVPIIHTEADMGSLAPAIGKESSSTSKRWERHKQAVSSFWATIRDYLLHLDLSNLRIYQDGLAADGDLGKRVVDEAARRGSENYQIVLELMNRGAEIRKTEDIALLVEEYQSILRLTKATTIQEKKELYVQYEARKKQLTEERDQFIAHTINSTLRPGETGLLFLGAYHNVLPHLDKDIVVEFVKDPMKISTYFEEAVAGTDDLRYEELLDYVVSPIKNDV